MPHLADGDIDAERSLLSDGEAGVDETVARMAEMAKGVYGARSPKIRALAINIINKAGVGNKDYYGMAKAIHEWVRDTIRYVKDPVGQETLSYPEETAFNSKAGDCDDLTILDMALLGSVGIRSYPVVVGMRKGHFSHVYLNIIIPDGGRPGRHAGEHIPADPIMREWPLGQEAPAHKIAARKTYEDLAGLGTMLSGYMTGPSYIDAANVPSVVPALRAALVDTASRGEILNAPKVDEHNTDEIDDLFQTIPELAWQGAPWSAQGPLGPITGAEASGTYSDLPHRRYERAIAAPRSFKRRVKRVTDDWYNRGKAPNTVMIDEPRVDEVNEDLAGIGTYIDSIMGEALGDTPTKVAAVASLARHRVALARHGMAQVARAAGKSKQVRQQLRRRGGFMPGMGELAAAVEQKAAQLEHLSVAANGAKAKHAQHLMRRFEAAGLTASVDATKTASFHKIKAIQIALYTALALPKTPAIHDEAAIRNITPPLARNIQHGLGRKIGHGLLKNLPPGSFVKTRDGRVVQRQQDMQGLGSLFSKLKSSVSTAIKKISAPIAIPVHQAYEKLPTPLKKVLNVGLGVPLAAALSPLTLIGESKPVYAINRAALGNKAGGLLTNVERIGTVAVAAALTAGAATGTLSSGPVSALLGVPGQSAGLLVPAESLPGFAPEIPAYAVGAGVAPGAEVAGTAAAASTSWLASAGAAIAAHPFIAAGVLGGAAILDLTAAAAAKRKKAAAAAQPAATGIDPTTGLPYGTTAAAIDSTTGQPYGAIDPATGLPYSSETAGAIDPATGIPYAQEQAAAAMSPYSAAAMSTDPYGGEIPPGMENPYDANYGSPDMTAPVDSFGPQDMGPAVSAPSAADMGPTDDGGAQDAGDQYAPDDSGDEDATEGSAPAPAPRRKKRKQYVTADTSTDEGADESADDDGGSSDGDLDVDTSITPDRRSRRGDGTTSDLSDFSIAGMGVGTLAVVGLGLYLLMRKKKRA
jgi:hypothetical protein